MFNGNVDDLLQENFSYFRPVRDMWEYQKWKKIVTQLEAQELYENFNRIVDLKYKLAERSEKFSIEIEDFY